MGSPWRCDLGASKALGALFPSRDFFVGSLYNFLMSRVPRITPLKLLLGLLLILGRKPGVEALIGLALSGLRRSESPVGGVDERMDGFGPVDVWWVSSWKYDRGE